MEVLNNKDLKREFKTNLLIDFEIFIYFDLLFLLYQ
jgi:hypothetical protein